MDGPFRRRRIRAARLSTGSAESAAAHCPAISGVKSSCGGPGEPPLHLRARTTAWPRGLVHRAHRVRRRWKGVENAESGTAQPGKTRSSTGVSF
jgi:hypothetical protein